MVAVSLPDNLGLSPYSFSPLTLNFTHSRSSVTRYVLNFVVFLRQSLILVRVDYELMAVLPQSLHVLVELELLVCAAVLHWSIQGWRVSPQHLGC